MRRARSALRTASLLVALVASVAPRVVGAQIIRVPRKGQPTVWVTGGVAWYQSQAVNDGTTNTVWDFGDAAQYRGSLEWALRNQASIGVAGSFARVPFRYLHGPGTTPPPTPCDGCDGHIDVSSLVGLFRIGGGQGFHQVIEGQAGVTRYSKLRADDGTELAPDTDQDFTFALGYGVGYGFGPRFQISVVQDFGFNLHQKAGLTNNANTTIQNRVTRLTLRYGLFSQKPKV